MRYLIVFAFFCLLLSACAPSGNDTTEVANTAPKVDLLADTLGINADDLSLFKEQLPILGELLEGKGLQNTVAVYANRVIRGKVNSQKDLEDLLDTRSKIITLLHDKLLNPFFSRADTGDFYNSERGASLEKELNRIGIQSVSAEGMYIGLSTHKMLEKEFKRFADEAFGLYNDFVSQRGNSLGGEYPYLRLEHQMELVWLGEQLLDKYPQSPYSARIRSDFRFALLTLTDFHCVSTPVQGMYYIVSGLLTEPYPTMTDVGQLNDFVKRYPHSKYSRLTKELLESTSDIKLDADSQPKTVYLVVMKWLAADSSDENADCEIAEQLRNDYLDRGVASPHLLRLVRRGETQCAVCYRFYSSASKASAALERVKKIEPNVEGVFKANYNTTTNVWTAE